MAILECTPGVFDRLRLSYKSNTTPMLLPTRFGVLFRKRLQ